MYRYTPLADVKEFHDTFCPDHHDQELYLKLRRRKSLAEEEFEEVTDALDYLELVDNNLVGDTIENAKEELAKELADLLYVIYGTAEELDIPLEWVFKAVHKSNMSKVWPDGTVKRNGFGKILKPDTYAKPDLSFIHEHRVL